MTGFSLPSIVHAGAGRPDAGRLYESADTRDDAMQLFSVGTRPDGRPLVEVAANFECDDLELTGVALATVKRDGTFSVKSRGFTLAGGGTDEIDATVAIRGRFRGDKANGTIDAEGRAFDNAGTTGTCDDEIDWKADAGAPDAALERITATVRLKPAGSALVAADGDAVYVAAGSDDPKTARLHRVDAVSAQPAWSVRTRVEVDGLAAGAGGVWAIEADRNRVLRFDPATGDRVAEIALEPASDLSPSGFSAPIAATDAAVWVATPGGLLHRIDPATNTATAMNLFSDRAQDVVLGTAADAVYVGVELPPEPPVTPFGIFRIDAATATPSAVRPRAFGQLEALAPSDGDLWALLFADGLVRFDSGSLMEVDRIDVDGAALAAATPGAWVLTADGLLGFEGGSASPVVTIPVIGGDFGALATSADAVWVWDPRLGALTRVQAG